MLPSSAASDPISAASATAVELESDAGGAAPGPDPVPDDGGPAGWPESPV